MRNKKLIISLIVILSICIIGLITVMCLIINKKFKFLIHTGKRSNNIIYEESYELADINNIEILSCAGDVKFEESKNGKIKVVAYGENKDNLKVDLNENNLKIDYSNDNTKNFFGLNVILNDIIIYIPKNYDKNISIDLKYGNINVLKLENASINIKENYGNINIEKIKNATIKNDYGNIELGTVLNKLDIKIDCGDLKIANLELLEDSSIKSALGNVKIHSINNVYIDAHVNVGKCKINDINRRSDITLKADLDFGDLIIEN